MHKPATQTHTKWLTTFRVDDAAELHWDTIQHRRLAGGGRLTTAEYILSLAYGTGYKGLLFGCVCLIMALTGSLSSLDSLQLSVDLGNEPTNTGLDRPPAVVAGTPCSRSGCSLVTLAADWAAHLRLRFAIKAINVQQPPGGHRIGHYSFRTRALAARRLPRSSHYLASDSVQCRTLIKHTILQTCFANHKQCRAGAK